LEPVSRCGWEVRETI